jgi:hypothetical protein
VRRAVAGDPKNKQMILKIGPQRMAAMLRQLGKAGAVQVCTNCALGVFSKSPLLPKAAAARLVTVGNTPKYGII